MNTCLIVPFYRHQGAIAGTLAAVKPHGLPCFLIDDGSGPSCESVLARLAAQESGWLTLLRLSSNQGKGAAVMAGIQAAARAGFSHAIQLDADGQHDAADIARLLDLASVNPAAVVSGVAQYDISVPRSRRYGRAITHFWVWIHTLSFQIRDSMCGLRLYPIEPALTVWRGMRWGRRMDFDTEILVRMFWAGVPVLGVPTRVTYPADGVSHFDLWRDNLRISWMHARLFAGMLWRMPRLLARRFAPSSS